MERRCDNDVKQALVVAHSRTSGEELALLVREFGISIVVTDDAECACRTLMSGVSAVFLWASLPDGLAIYLARLAARMLPVPNIVAISDESNPDLFDLAKAGARVHLRWPATKEEVRMCLECADETRSELEVVVHIVLGEVDLRNAQTQLKRAMLQKALAYSHGSRRATARILGVTRPAVQRMIREDLDEGGSEESTTTWHESWT